MDISFCIPAYNCAQYIEYCIKSIDQAVSILKKTGGCAEINIVEDGSTDDTMSTLYKIQAMYSELPINIVTNGANKGVSYSRNKAFSMANGRYVWFVDADDMIVPESLTLMVEFADKNKLNWVLGNFVKVDSSQSYPLSYGKKVFKIIENNKDQIENYAIDQIGNICNGASSGIYRSTFLREQGLSFDERLAYCEDIMFNFDIMLCIDRIAKLEFATFNYRFNPGSTTKRKDSAHRRYQVERFIDLYNILDEHLMLRKYNPPGKCNNEETLIIKKEQTKQSIARVLVEVDDCEYIRKKMRYLKENGLYPYKYGIKDLQTGQLRFKKTVLIYALSKTPTFWLVHYCLAMVRRLR